MDRARAEMAPARREPSDERSAHPQLITGEVSRQDVGESPRSEESRAAEAVQGDAGGTIPD